MKTDTTGLITHCEFETTRLKVSRLEKYFSKSKVNSNFSKQIIAILSDEVTQSLPNGWQEISTVSQAVTWITDRKSDGLVSVITVRPKEEVVGFLFLSEEHTIKRKGVNIRLGYLLAKKVWGQGLGSELIGGLVEWSKKSGNISLISGGVNTNNIASSRVLVKNGFIPSVTESVPDEVKIYERKFDIDNIK